MSAIAQAIVQEQHSKRAQWACQFTSCISLAAESYTLWGCSAMTWDPQFPQYVSPAAEDTALGSLDFDTALCSIGSNTLILLDEFKKEAQTRILSALENSSSTSLGVIGTEVDQILHKQYHFRRKHCWSTGDSRRSTASWHHSWLWGLMAAGTAHLHDNGYPKLWSAHVGCPASSFRAELAAIWLALTDKKFPSDILLNIYTDLLNAIFLLQHWGHQDFRPNMKLQQLSDITCQLLTALNDCTAETHFIKAKSHRGCVLNEVADVAAEEGADPNSKEIFTFKPVEGMLFQWEHVITINNEEQEITVKEDNMQKVGARWTSFANKHCLQLVFPGGTRHKGPQSNPSTSQLAMVRTRGAGVASTCPMEEQQEQLKCRPDRVVWNQKERQIIFLELTRCMDYEDNVTAARANKSCQYNIAIAAIKLAQNSLPQGDSSSVFTAPLIFSVQGSVLLGHAATVLHSVEVKEEHVTAILRRGVLAAIKGLTVMTGASKTALQNFQNLPSNARLAWHR
eukprot:1631735-Rhodomonas_salina.1